MSKTEELKATYLKDVQMSASKSKFGFFSIPPPVSAGDETYHQKKVIKDQNGKVKTEQRNILPGLCSTGVLKKSYFSYTPSYKQGDVYQDPGKVDRLNNLKSSQKFKDKDTFRPASLNKTICTASYEYLPQKQNAKNPKMYRNQDGKVKSSNPNICTSPASKIEYNRTHQYKYVNDPYDNARLQRRKQLFAEISKRSENAFKPSSPSKPYFSSYKEQFQTVNVSQKKKQKVSPIMNHNHDSQFRPGGNSFNNGIFSSPEYLPQGSTQRKVEKSMQKKEAFKLIKVEKNSRPCPSISLSKMNLMRSFR